MLIILQQIYLFLNRKNIKVVLSDINEKPLMRAHDNLLKYHLEDKIELRLGNGLEVMDDSITTIIISGMGSVNMIDILRNIKIILMFLKLFYLLIMILIY